MRWARQYTETSPTPLARRRLAMQRRTCCSSGVVSSWCVCACVCDARVCPRTRQLSTIVSVGIAQVYAVFILRDQASERIQQSVSPAAVVVQWLHRLQHVVQAHRVSRWVGDLLTSIMSTTTRLCSAPTYASRIAITAPSSLPLHSTASWSVYAPCQLLTVLMSRFLLLTSLSGTHSPYALRPGRRLQCTTGPHSRGEPARSSIACSPRTHPVPCRPARLSRSTLHHRRPDVARVLPSIVSTCTTHSNSV
jgi:hypothetical protein